MNYSVDLADKKSVKAGNKAMMEMIKIVKLLSNREDGMDEFSKLLSIEDSYIRCYSAIHIIEHIYPNKELRERCLSIIRYVVEKDDHIGYRYWLKEWDK